MLDDIIPASSSASDNDKEYDNDDIVRIDCALDEHGVPTAHATLTPHSDRRSKEVYCDPRQPIPVIFIPGIMGTLLGNKESGEKIWWPPNKDSAPSTIAAGGTIIAGWFASATKRAKNFDPIPAIVDPRGPLASFDEKKLGFDAKEARRRGWNTVHRWSYQRMLAWLQYTLDRPMQLGKLCNIWACVDTNDKDAPMHPVLGTPPSRYGASHGEALSKDSEAFKSFVTYRYPVYAVGYNFLQSNEKSALDVLEGLNFTDPVSKEVTRIKGIREICRENHTDKAIIITHSMGGLVARMACQFHDGAKDMLGVIHGAQPATGAPLFAKRFRTGGEGRSFLERLINQSLLGRNAAEFVAIASNAEGPMELAPTPDYHDGEPWWIFMDETGKECLRLPETSALEDLYINDAWYGLLPDSSLLDPAGLVKKRLNEQRITLNVHQHFKKTMGDVVDRQKALINIYHPNTYALYGKGALMPLSCDRVEAQDQLEAGKSGDDLLSYGNVVWQGNIPEGTTATELKSAKMMLDNHKGELTVLVRGQSVRLTVQRAPVAADRRNDKVKDNGIVAGDATVPVWSAEAQGRGTVPGVPGDCANGVQMVFVQGGYEHQFCFDHPWARWATLYSVAQIVHSIKTSAR